MKITFDLCYSVRYIALMKKKLTLIEVRQKLSDLCFKAGGVREWADSKGLSYSNVYKVIRGDGKPGKKIMRKIRIKQLVGDGLKEPRYEDI